MISTHPPEPLMHTSRDFVRPRGADFAARTREYAAWATARQESELYQYGRTLAGRPAPQTAVIDAQGRAASSLNFSSQDYLGLSSEPSVLAAASAAMTEFGVHSAGSPMVIGNTRISRELEQDLAEFLGMRHVLLFPTGWAAGFGAITGLVRPYDFVVMDRLAHACLQQGAHAATSQVRKHAHLDVGAAEELLRDIRASHPDAGILVVSEGLFSMDADSPRLGKLQEVCHDHGATLLVDVAHDLGASGPGGQGQIGLQGCHGKIDLVMGSFSKTFASNGGFVATNDTSIYEYLRMFSNAFMFSNALSPVQAAVVRRSLAIARSEAGEERRLRLGDAVSALRERLEEHGLKCYGQPSPIVPVAIGSEALARLVHRELRHRQLAATVIEFPIVPQDGARLRLQVMATHSRAQSQLAADVIAVSLDAAQRELTGPARTGSEG